MTTQIADSLQTIFFRMPFTLQQQLRMGTDGAGGRGDPRRLCVQAPVDTGAFILPLKQSVIKNARLMPGTRCMLALLAGWTGRGGPLEVTQATIAKHLGRSVRQVYRYLQDAAREGYLRYAYTKCRLGMITGLRIYLTFDLIRKMRAQDSGQTRGSSGRTLPADTKNTDTDQARQDPKLDLQLERFRRCLEAPPQ